MREWSSDGERADGSVSRMLIRTFALLLLLLAGTHAFARAGDPLEDVDPDFMRSFDAQYEKVWGDGAVSAKQKQLAGIALGVTIKCEICTKYHVREAWKRGATRDEIVEMLRVALVGGGSGGIPTMRAAAQQLLELEKEKAR
jgi:AhpD family alkylhydroperoxidase